MTRSDSIEAIRSSIARGSATPTLGSTGRDAYIVQQARALEDAAIAPAPATIHGVAYDDQGLLALLATNPPLVIAHRSTNWLGYIPPLGEFFLAYGPDSDNLNALGFHSDDALAEWLG